VIFAAGILVDWPSTTGAVEVRFFVIFVTLGILWLQAQAIEQVGVLRMQRSSVLALAA
jgi:hypothetical protein